MFTIHQGDVEERLKEFLAVSLGQEHFIFVTIILRERQLRLYGHVARPPAEDPAHRILSCRDLRG